MRVSKTHAWIERKLGVIYGVYRIDNSDALVYIRLGDGKGNQGLCKFEVGFIWWFFYATWGEEWSKSLKERL